jgi:hypothetical protein
MICEGCKRRGANVFLTQIIDGEPVKLSLCESCAAPILDHIPDAGTSESEPALLSECFSLAPDPNRPKSVTLPDPIAVRTLASSLHAKPFEIIRDLMYFDIFGTVNTDVAFSTASELCSRYGITAAKVA